VSILIERIPNKPIDSNSFVIYSDVNNSCIIVDPGTKDCANLISFIKNKSLTPEYIFLTHEHFDHIWGVNILKEMFNLKIVCSDVCSSMIVDKKKNLSLFYDQIGFETYPADMCIEELNYFVKWNTFKIEVMKTPGHSEGSVCFLIENNLFTGDTIINNKKTIIKLPSGNRLKLIDSLSILQKRFGSKKPAMYPGHGEPFQFEEIRNQEFVK
jgi:hydroxyacylglutathione hydrolase